MDCARHAIIYFNSKDLDLINAAPGRLSIIPTIEMKEVLKRDYDLMSGMIFGEIPSFSEILIVILGLQDEPNIKISTTI